MIEFVLGKPQSKKSVYLQQKALEAAAGDVFSPVWYLVPEQYTLQTQRELIRQNNSKGLLNLEVLSFNRFVYRLQNELSLAGKLALKGSSRAALLYRLLEEAPERFPLLAKKRKSHAFIKALAKMLTECYQYRMTPEKLKELAAKMPGELLRDKTSDLAELLAVYAEAVRREYFVVEAALGEVAALLRQSELGQTEVFVDGFYGFVPLQLEILSVLIEKAKAVHIALPYAWKDEERLGFGDLRYPSELYFDIKNTISKLRELSAPEKLTLIKESLPEVSPGILKIEAELFQQPEQPEQEECGQLHIAEAASREEELRYVAEEILYYVYEKGYRFCDLAVLTGNLEEYAERAEQIFKEYQLTCFVDRKETIRLHPLLAFLESALQAVRTRFRYEEMMQHLKSVYICLPSWDREKKEAVQTEISRLDIMATERGFRGLAAYEKAEGLSLEMRQILQDIRQLEQGIRRESSFSGKLTALEEYLQSRQVFPAIEKQVLELEERQEWTVASQYRQVCRKVQEHLAEMRRFMELPSDQPADAEKGRQLESGQSEGREEVPEAKGEPLREGISVEDFAALLLAGMSELEYASAPPVPDQIVIGSLEHTRLPKTKVVFAIGLTENNVPSIQPDNGFFSDWERLSLKNAGTEFGLAEDRKTSIFKAQLTIFMSLLSATEQLYLSFAGTGSDGRTQRPAELYYQICRMFPRNKVKNLTKWWQEHEKVTYPKPTLVSFMKQWQAGGENKDFFRVYQSLKNSWARATVEKLTQPVFEPMEKISAELADSLYGRQRGMSVSRLESYSACPFLHFIRYGLKAREIMPYQAERVDIGMFLHKVMEMVHRLSRKAGKQLFEMEETEYRDVLQQAVKEAVQADRRDIFTGSARNGFLAERLTALADRALETMRKQLQRGKMSFYREELRFRREDMADLRFFTEDGEEFFLEGVIDRIDISREGKFIYFSVLDYKTSEHELDYTEIFYGLQLQLLIYLEAGEQYLRKEDGALALPVGAAYFHLKDPLFSQTDIGMGELPAEEDFLKAMRLKGVFVLEELSRLDGSLHERSLVTNVRLKKDGSPYAGSMALPAAELKRLTGFAHAKAEEIAGRIRQGDAEIKPYYYNKRTPCAYCRYSGICKIDRKERPYRYLTKKDKADVIGEENKS